MEVLNLGKKDFQDEHMKEKLADLPGICLMTLFNILIYRYFFLPVVQVSNSTSYNNLVRSIQCC